MVRCVIWISNAEPCRYPRARHQSLESADAQANTALRYRVGWRVCEQFVILVSLARQNKSAMLVGYRKVDAIALQVIERDQRERQSLSGERIKRDSVRTMQNEQLDCIYEEEHGEDGDVRSIRQEVQVQRTRNQTDVKSERQQTVAD